MWGEEEESLRQTPEARTRHNEFAEKPLDTQSVVCYPSRAPIYGGVANRVKCPYCGHNDDHVLDSRPVREGSVIRRRRECVGCGRRFTTFEEIEEKRLMVIKKDGRREPYSRGKLLRGMEVACRKRPVATGSLDRAADEIEQAIFNSGEPEISSTEIGNLIMERLLLMDPVAYVRFASVYLQFEDAGQFREIVEGMRKGRRSRR
jgi:transcriptional repressor NrdR